MHAVGSHKQLLLNCVYYEKYNSALLWLSAGVQVLQKSLLLIAFPKFRGSQVEWEPVNVVSFQN